MTVPDSSPANDGSADDKGTAPVYENPNELGTEISEEAEQALINETLGIEGAKTDESSTKPEDEKPSDGGDGTPAVPEEKPAGDEKPPAPPKEEEKPAETPEAPAKPTPEVKDENGVQTDDLWVEVERLVEDKDGNTSTEKVKLVFDPQNPSAFLPDDFKFKSDKQLFEILDAKSEMAALYKTRESEFNEKKAENDSKTQAEQSQEAQIKAWDEEIADLIDSGIMEAPKVKPGDDNWKEDPSVKHIEAVFKYMTEQNTERVKEGKEPIKSFGTVLAKFEKVQADKAAEDQKKADNDKAKAKGAMVGGSSAASSGGGDKAAYKSGSYGSIWEVPVE